MTRNLVTWSLINLFFAKIQSTQIPGTATFLKMCGDATVLEA